MEQLIMEAVRDLCQTSLINPSIFHSQRGSLDIRLSQREAVNRHGLSSGLGYTCACAKKLQIKKILTTQTRVNNRRGRVCYCIYHCTNTLHKVDYRILPCIFDYSNFIRCLFTQLKVVKLLSWRRLGLLLV